MKEERIAYWQKYKSVEECIEKLKKDWNFSSVEIQNIPFEMLTSAGMEPGAILCIVEYILFKMDMRFPTYYVKAVFDRFLQENCLTVIQVTDSIEKRFAKEKQKRDETNKIDEEKQTELAAKELHMRIEAGEDPLLMYINYNNEFVYLREHHKIHTERFIFLKCTTRLMAEYFARVAVRNAGYIIDDKGRYIQMSN